MEDETINSNEHKNSDQNANSVLAFLGNEIDLSLAVCYGLGDPFPTRPPDQYLLELNKQK